jgi:iron uptake system component EfeO
MSTLPRVRLLLPAVLACALVACGGSDANKNASARTINITLTPDGCAPPDAKIPAGAVTFKVTNKNASAVSEFEILQGDRILGEKENLTPGLSGSFSLNLQPGSYTAYCPGAKTEKTTLEVTGGSGSNATAAAQDDPELARAVAGYQTYVQQQAAELVMRTQALVQAVEAGDIATAKTLYAAARPFYERIEPVAESFGDLDPAIDARVNDVDDPAQWTGFHRIEKALWVDNSTAGMSPVAQKLLADTKKLQELVATTAYQPAELANGASELLDEVGKSKLTGEEERYSRLDMLDVIANVEGSKQAYDLLKPALVKRDANLARTIDERFTTVQNLLTPYRQGDSYVSYERISQDDIRRLSQAVDALAEPVSEVAAKIVGGP